MTQIPVEPGAVAQAGDAPAHEIRPDVAYRRLGIVNVVFIGPSRAPDRGWVLVDTGIIGMKPLITAAAEERFGSHARPCAIVLTHGHFDHVGALEALSEQWDVPVVAHPLEAPYLDGSAAYPPADATVGGGLMSTLSPLFPRGPVNVKRRLAFVAEDGTVPFMPGWRAIHTAGHTPGHVSLWREQDRTLIAGDAFITTAQESAYAAAVTQEPELHGPPMYFTLNWILAQKSVETLAALEPELVVAGHGRPMKGDAMRRSLHELARRFQDVAVPKHSAYLERPAWADDGSAYRDV